MLTIIEIAAREDGGHGLQSQSHRTACWLEGWVAVPPELEQVAWDCRGYCQLELEEGVLVGITPGEPPQPQPEPEAVPSETEQLRADVDELHEALDMILTGTTE